MAGALDLALFGALLLALLSLRSPTGAGAGRMLERLAARGGGPLGGLRAGIAGGLVRPRQPGRQLGVIAASVAMGMAVLRQRGISLARQVGRPRCAA